MISLEVVRNTLIVIGIISTIGGFIADQLISKKTSEEIRQRNTRISTLESSIEEETQRKTREPDFELSSFWNDEDGQIYLRFLFKKDFPAKIFYEITNYKDDIKINDVYTGKTFRVYQGERMKFSEPLSFEWPDFCKGKKSCFYEIALFNGESNNLNQTARENGFRLVGYVANSFADKNSSAPLVKDFQLDVAPINDM